MRKRTYLIIGLVIIILLISGCVGNKPPQSGKDKEKLPVTTVIPTVTSSIQETSSITPHVAGCQKSSNNIYGGINGNENIPPDGTVIDKDLTKYYGRLAATGVCGTYQYISGWWFNETEMGRLPFKSMAYGESPYVTDEGSDTQEPIIPVPESSTLILTALGILTVIMLRKYKK